MTVTPIVSIVTPVYNGQRYLIETIQSVLNQTYSDWEYLIYDNQSTDDTVAIASRFAAQEPRIRLERTTEFLPVNANHNRAFRAISPRSRYCKFVHADDWLYPECVARMVAVADQNPSVGVVSSYRLEDRNVEHDGLMPHSQTVMCGLDVVRSALRGPPWVTGSPTSLLYRTEQLRSYANLFDETYWHADTECTYRTLMKSDLGFVHQVLTFTRLHPGAFNLVFTSRKYLYLAQWTDFGPLRPARIRKTRVRRQDARMAPGIRVVSHSTDD